MTFEEELLKEMVTYKPLKINWFIFKEVIDKHCVEKHTLKKIIEGMAIQMEGCEMDRGWNHCIERILEELKL